MALDPYALCPCGNGQKIKFCCSADIMTELDKVFRSIEGDQRAAALDQLNRLLATRPNNPALLAIKGSILLTLDDVDAADQTITKFVAVDPKNPTALAQSAALAAMRGNSRQAVERLQTALEEANGRISYQVHSALRLVGELLLAQQNILGAFGHLMLYSTTARSDNDDAKQMMQAIRTSPNLPLFLRRELFIKPAPEGAAWKPRFDEILQLAGKACWLKACEQFIALCERVPNEPTIIHNIAVLRGYLGDTSGAVLWWHKYSTLEAVPFEERVEAEALAQIVDPNLPTALTDVVELTVDVADVDRVMEILLGEKRLVSQDRERFAQDLEEGEIPPKAVFAFLNRALPPTAAGLSVDDIPVVAGTVLVFGRQTDRPAQVKLIFQKTPSSQGGKDALVELLGDQASGQAERVVSQIPSEALTLNESIYPPRDTTREQFEEFSKKTLERGIFERWPQTKSRYLDNHTPVEVAGNPSYRIRLLAAILQLEEGNLDEPGLELNRLRSQLGLPTLDAIDPTSQNLDLLPVWRLMRVDPGKLTDEQLINAYFRSLHYAESALIVRFGEELLKRPNVEQLVNVAELYSLLIRVYPDAKRSVELAQAAQEYARKHNASPAPFMLLELQSRLALGDGPAAQRLIEVLSSRHSREPGIAQALMQILTQLGLITPDGRVRGTPTGAPPPPPGAEPAAAASGLWTPGDPVAPPAEKKSSLWLPD